MLDIKYRPLTFRDVLGQEKIKTVLKSRVVSHTCRDVSYLFSGPYGSGKTTLARIYARAMLCEATVDGEPCNACPSCISFMKEQNLSYEERDAAGHGTIDGIRAIVDNLTASLFSQNKIVLFDESHRMSRDSQDCLLKPIEDKKLTCVFCTTELSKMRAAIRSRCESFILEPIYPSDIAARLKLICVTEGIEFEEKALAYIVDYSKCHVRDALNALEQVSKAGVVSVENVKNFLNFGWSQEILEVIDSILCDNASKALSQVDVLIHKMSAQDIYANIMDNIINILYLHKACLTPISFDKDMGAKLLSQYQVDLIVKFMSNFNRSLRYLDRPMLVCEVMLLMEKLHRGYAETTTSSTLKSRPVLSQKSNKDVDALTPIDHMAMNPAKRNAPTYSPPTVKLVGSSVHMEPTDFISKFKDEWGS
jgi:DNA polymerase III subunit gamma/tau